MSPDILNPTTLLAILAGLGVGGGIALLVASLVGWPRKEHSGPTTSARFIAFARRRGAAAVIAALVVLAVTRWPVAALAAAALALFWNKLFGGAKEEKAAMERVEALAGWTESLRDTMAGAVGLESAIQSSIDAASPALRPHVAALVNRLRARTPFPIALDLLAEDLDDGSADIVIIALKENSRQRGPGLAKALTGLAELARKEADMRRDIMAQRSGTRRSVKIVVTVCVVFPLGMALFNPAYVVAYQSLQGQGVLTVVLAFFAAGLAWLRHLSIVPAGARLLAPAGGAR
ncbi:type II secretion system F family protein (plasmid) [Kitasatospora sp. NBC_00374]|uniref:type II secretion system F family protein n=1 Tax=Kitasatospora sp. NBC_00374 TaxID=2975964 RepID=UPI002F9144F2